MVHRAMVDMDLLDNAALALSRAQAIFDCLGSVEVDALEERTVSEMGWWGMELLGAVEEFVDSIEFEEMELEESEEVSPELTD